MTSNYYTDPSRDYTHMYNVKDIKGPLPQPVFNPNTLLGYLLTNPEVRDYFELIVSNKGMAGLYNNTQAEYTLFIPVDCHNIRPDNQEAYAITKILEYHTLERIITPELLSSSGAILVNTRLSNTQILVENKILGGKKHTFLNEGQARVVGYKKIGQSNIFFIDNILTLFNKVL